MNPAGVRTFPEPVDSELGADVVADSVPEGDELLVPVGATTVSEPLATGDSLLPEELEVAVGVATGVVEVLSPPAPTHQAEMVA